MTLPVRFRGRDDKGALVRGSVVSAVAMFVMLSGIAECASNCPVYDENGDQVFGPDGNPVSVACINCIESNPPPCKSDAWSLAEGVACDAANQPSVPDGTACDFSEDGDGTCTAGVCDGPRFPCTEQGVLDAIAAGGGPRYFDCPGPTTINTTAEVVIDNDVTLDFEGLVTLDAGDSHRVLSVASGVVAEVRGVTVTNGGGLLGGCEPYSVGFGAGAGICNAGDLTLRSSMVVSNGSYDDLTAAGTAVGGIWSAVSTAASPASLRLIDCVVSGNEGWTGYGIPSGVFAVGTIEIIRSTIADNRVGPALTVGDSLFQQQYASSILIEDSVIDGVYSQTTIEGVVPTVAIYGTIANASIRQSTVSGTDGAVSMFPDTTNVSTSFLVQNSTLVGGNSFGLRVGASFGAGLTTELFGSAFVPGCSNSGAPISLGYNIDTNGTCGLSDPTDQTVSAAALNIGPLQDNGGPTQTFLPETGSIAIDAIPAAECTLTTDQRGISRPQGAACDIGAVEVEQP